MTQIEQNPLPGGSRRRVELWIVAALVIAAAIIAWVLVGVRPGRAGVAGQQRQRFQLLADAVVQYAKQNEGELPDDPSALTITDATGSSIEIATLLSDAATSSPVIYRVVTEAGERIRYSFLGTRVIAWSPQASYDGRRAVVLNGGDVRFLPDRLLDLKDQRADVGDPPEAMRPKLTVVSQGEDDDSDDEPAETDQTSEADGAATTVPATRPDD